MTKARGGQRGNKNASSWTFEDKMRLHHMVEKQLADGISDRKAIEMIARDRQLYSQLPVATGPHRIADSEQKRGARYLKRLQWPLRVVAKLTMPYMTVTDFEQVASKIEDARRTKDGLPPTKL
jgi:hypothetical protein